MHGLPRWPQIVASNRGRGPSQGGSAIEVARQPTGCRLVRGMSANRLLLSASAGSVC